MKTMQTPTTRAEFEHNFHLLAEKMRQGKFHFAPGTSMGLEKVRYLPNGRIDFLSVDESARLQANMIAQFSDEEFRAKIEEGNAKITPTAQKIRESNAYPKVGRNDPCPCGSKKKYKNCHGRTQPPA